MLILLTSLFFNVALSYESPFKWSGNLYKIIRNYEMIHKKFSKKVCTPGTDFLYEKRIKDYRGSGIYLPLINNSVDIKAINSNLSYFPKKKYYIHTVIKRLKKLKTAPNSTLASERIKVLINDLLDIKLKYHLALKESKKKTLLDLSRKKMNSLFKEYQNFINIFFYLKNYNFPNDHLANRKKYEELKDSDKHQANKTYTYRKIIEDGTFSKGRSRSDKNLRTTIETLFYRLQRNTEAILNEDIRFDLDYVLSGVTRINSEGLKKLIRRNEKWLKRVTKVQEFYYKIVKQKKIAVAEAHHKNKATKVLTDFVYGKQAESYLFWKKQPELLKALFVLETILFNEVGVVDGKYALDRKDVAQVVFNRLPLKEFSMLKKGQLLTNFLDSKDYKDEPWLNTLFRVGEFSFTYHYIGSVKKIFCPDMSYRGRQLRKTNLKLLLKALKNTRPEFKVLRYFSRVSMLGRIDMSSVWSDYLIYPERAGYEVSGQRKLNTLYNAGKYHYHYSFRDPSGKEFQVVEIAENVYAVALKRNKNKFYFYRNPQLFKYFVRK